MWTPDIFLHEDVSFDMATGPEKFKTQVNFENLYFFEKMEALNGQNEVMKWVFMYEKRKIIHWLRKFYVDKIVLFLDFTIWTLPFQGIVHFSSGYTLLEAFFEWCNSFCTHDFLFIIYHNIFSPLKICWLFLPLKELLSHSYFSITIIHLDSLFITKFWILFSDP